MGIRAAKSAVLVAARLGLSDKAARCLVHMALESMDKPDESRALEARRFYQGRDSIAVALGYVGAATGTSAARAAVKRAIAQLVDNEAVQVYREGHAGYRTEYYLRIRSDVSAGSDELLPALESTPALVRVAAMGSARRTPVSKEANGLRTRQQRETDPQDRSKPRDNEDEPKTPGVPQGARPAYLEGHARRGDGARPASGSGTPGVPPKKREQEEQDEQYVSRTRVRASMTREPLVHREDSRAGEVA